MMSPEMTMEKTIFHFSFRHKALVCLFIYDDTIDFKTLVTTS